MARNTLVINCDIGETRVALIQNGILAELHVERRGQRGIVGNIYLGKVSRVLPGMQAAFIDIGEERAAFLHVEDLIRPADFEAYLAGSKRGERDELLSSKSEKHGHAHADDEEDEEEDGDEALAATETHAEAHDEEADASADVEPIEEPDAPVLREPRDEDEVIVKTVPRDDQEMATRRGRRRRGGRSGQRRKDIAADASADANADAAGSPEGEGDDGDDEDDEALTPEDGKEGRDGKAERDPQSASKLAAAASASKLVAGPVAEDTIDVAAIDAELEGISIEEEFGFTIGDGVASAARPAAGRREPIRSDATQRQTREGGRSGSGRGRGSDRRGGRRSGGSGGASSGESDKRPARDGGLRLARSVPINEVVKEGQEVIVQVTKEPIGTKGARVSSHVSLPGRYVVYLPTVEHVGVSRRIGSDHERRRLREAIEAMKPPQGGLIVRTLAEGLTKKQLKADVGYLVRLWGEILKKREEAARNSPKAAPMVLYQELDVVLRTARDMFTDDVERIVIDDKEQYQRLLRFIEMFMPERASAIELYSNDEPVFDAYGLEDEISRVMARKVPLPSGGYLVIDEAEALTAIDVNSGRYVGRGNRDPEDTILQTNLEAVAEIAYQLRFRNIGGLIVLDLIDMEKASNREKVYRALEQALLADKAKTSINRISELGLVEMTRKRTRESLGRSLHEACFYCDGTGQLQSRTTIAYEILRQIRRERQSLTGYKIIVNAHPSVIDLLQTQERETLKEAERRYQRQLLLVPHKEYHIEQFDLAGT